MLKNNNPDIDIDALNNRIQQQLEQYQNSADNIKPPVFDIKAKPIAAQNGGPSVTSLGELLALEDSEFVEQAYLLMLARPADPTGRDHYLNILRSGEDKLAILTELKLSAEGQANPSAPGGFRKAKLKRKLSRLPVVGKVLKNLMPLTATASFQRFIQARFNHFHRVTESHQQALKQLPVLTADQLNHRRQIKELHQLIENQNQLLQTQQEQHQKEIAQLKLRLRMLENRPVQQTTESAPATSAAPVTVEQNSAPAVEDAFYVAFEQHFRGDQASVRARLDHYTPLLHKNQPLWQQGLPAVDIGCGRGEWLNVLKEQGLKTIGIDLNAINVELCQESGHQAYQTDALAWLAQQADNSLAQISSFHVIEHLTFEQLNLLLKESMRTLAPGGLMIMETPNPENLVTGITHFYTDPTHLKPLPPAFTEFMVSYAGFSEVEVHRLNPIPEELAIQATTEVERRCNTLFYGPQDYAVIAVKPHLDN